MLSKCSVLSFVSHPCFLKIEFHFELQAGLELAVRLGRSLTGDLPALASNAGITAHTFPMLLIPCLLYTSLYALLDFVRTMPFKNGIYFDSIYLPYYPPPPRSH